MKRIVLLGASLILGGCAAGPPLRVSTAQLLPPENSEVTVAKSKTETVDLIKRLMAERGLLVKSVAPTKDRKAEYVVFSGPRRLLSGTNSIATVGSWIAVRVEPSEGGTHVKLLGKPNLGGQELCSDADRELADADYWCKDTSVNPSSPYYSQLTGREEAELITGLVTELKGK